VDAAGCPLDSDGDGVPDYLDKAPNTPKGVKVDADGRPLDNDGDGVPDYLDKCPDTPKNVKVNATGCPLDADADGVPDYLDKCPDTPKNVKVNATGCPLDADADGVPDYLDKCPDTPKGAKVDANGCPLDRDKDGVPDYMDKCPDVPGIAANKGCPEVKAETKKIFAQALQGIQFESGKDIIKKSSNAILDKVVKVMMDNPAYYLEINGYTDNTGIADKNLALSQKRADAVKNYLVKNGIDGEKLIARGFGQSFPVADNATAAGRAKNRRVEFKVNF
jgi:outer membrane protein OmpA-like peptidoglycan-associated protein